MASTPTLNSPPAPNGSTGQSTYDPATVQHALALTAVVVAPVIILMPPRKLDLYTFAASGMGIYGANHLVRERYNGRGIMSVAGERFGFVPPSARQQKPTSDSSSSPSPVFSSPTSLPTSLHTQPHHESPLERFSLPTDRARSIHESLAADREAAAWRLERYKQLRGRAVALQREGWAVGSDMRNALISARKQVEADARRHGWPAPSAPTEAERAITQDGGGLGLGWIKRRLNGSAHEAHGQAEVLASAAGEDSRSSNPTRTEERKEKEASWATGTEADEREGGVGGMVRRVWMGEEKEGWKERRLAEEQRALDDGKSYSDIILDQIWEVWNWDKKKDEEGNWVPKE